MKSSSSTVSIDAAEPLAVDSSDSVDAGAGTSRLTRRTAVAVATLAGAAAAATVLAAPALASSNGGTTWNHVASCESGQNWHINTGNSYHGGLQFSSSTWAAFGGHKYAGQADNASRVEQIA